MCGSVRDVNDGSGIMGARYVVERLRWVDRGGRRGWEEDSVRVGPCEKEGWDVSSVV